MERHDSKTFMQWAVIGISGFVLVTSVFVNIFNRDFNAQPAYYMFEAVIALVFGSSVFSKLKD